MRCKDKRQSFPNLFPSFSCVHPKKRWNNSSCAHCILQVRICAFCHCTNSILLPYRTVSLCTYLIVSAYHNPEAKITFLTSNIFQLPSYFQRFGNVQVKEADYGELFTDTPLEKWYQSGVWKVREQIPTARYLGDAARHAYIYKHGGIYLDTDMVTLRNLASLRNVLAYQKNWTTFKNEYVVLF